MERRQKTSNSILKSVPTLSSQSSLPSNCLALLYCTFNYFNAMNSVHFCSIMFSSNQMHLVGTKHNCTFNCFVLKLICVRSLCLFLVYLVTHSAAKIMLSSVMICE
jgi:hypothetical protein